MSGAHEEYQEAFSAVGWTSRNSRGAASELIACAYLIAQGYQVFRSVEPNGPLDVVAYRDGRLIGVEVKSVTWRREPKDCSPTFTWPRNMAWDLLLIVNVDGRVKEILTKDRDLARQQVMDWLDFRVRRLNTGFRRATLDAAREVRASGGTAGDVASRFGLSRAKAERLWSLAGQGAQTENGDD